MSAFGVQRSAACREQRKAAGTCAVQSPRRQSARASRPAAGRCALQGPAASAPGRVSPSPGLGIHCPFPIFPSVATAAPRNGIPSQIMAAWLPLHVLHGDLPRDHGHPCSTLRTGIPVAPNRYETGWGFHPEGPRRSDQPDRRRDRARTARISSVKPIIERCIPSPVPMLTCRTWKDSGDAWRRAQDRSPSGPVGEARTHPTRRVPTGCEWRFPRWRERPGTARPCGRTGSFESSCGESSTDWLLTHCQPIRMLVRQFPSGTGLGPL